MNRIKVWLVCLWVLSFNALFAQIGGKVLDNENETVIGASVLIKNTKIGAVTDFDGNFEIAYSGNFPVTLVVSYIGFSTKEVVLQQPNSKLVIKIAPDNQMLSEVSVVQRRLSEKQKESALTVEAMDVLAIKETPSVSFYEGLGNLKGVDLTSASIGFKVINTRGFNSTSPVRSLQLIDGVDNQAPGLNFSLGNFLGASELDVLNVDVIAGASTAFYGPSAFNGVIAMKTKSPFDFKGLSASVKVGERRLGEFAMRWAQVYKDKDGVDRFAYKINAYYLRADDWEATNLDPTLQSEANRDNPGGYDAVNRYGDEQLFNDAGDVKTYPGLGNFYRNGIEEQYLVDYNTENLKLGTSLHYRFKPDLELIYAFSFGAGTTVYQGDNRFSLKDITFYQNRIELVKKDKWFVRAYATNENAGNSYDAYFTALRMQESFTTDGFWGSRYSSLFNAIAVPGIKGLPGFPSQSLPVNEYEDQLNTVINDNLGYVTDQHNNIRNIVNTEFGGDALTPGTAAFDSLKTYITTRSPREGGSMLVDRSALYHIQGEYKFDEVEAGNFRVGGNFRLFRPQSDGSIFSDTLEIDKIENGDTIFKRRDISNYEFGLYLGWDKRIMDNRLKVSITSRLDKNQNFDLLFSPAASFVYDIDAISTVRFSFSSAIRNPTLQDQYLFYNVGRAILLGNLNGYDSLVTIDEVGDFLGASVPDRANWQWDYFSLDPVRPERVQTLEAGYRTTLWEKIYVDLNYYYSWYQDFIGYNIVLDIEDDPNLGPGDRLRGAQAYRIATNAQGQVTTQGFSAGLNYYFGNYYALSGNYTWNVLNTATDDPIIPAFNTPENKFNISWSARDWKIGKVKNLGFNVTYKWIQGFLFEGSPQFTGEIESYDMLDMQVSYKMKEWDTVFKLGASNLLNNQAYQVYGGPRVGRLAYFSVVYEAF